MNLKVQARHFGKLIQESSPTILTAVGVVGVAATAYLTAKATFKASDVLLTENKKLNVNATSMDDVQTYSTKEKSLLVWKLYIPAAGVGALSIVAIIAANRIQTRRLAALAAGYAMLSKDFDEYRDKAFEKLGIKKADELEKDIAKGKMARNPNAQGSVLPNGKTWFCDLSSMRYFPSTMETIKAAQNALNYKLNNQGSVSLNHFYEELDLETSDQIGDLLGWEPGNKIELSFVPILTEEYGAVTAFKFRQGAIPKAQELK